MRVCGALASLVVASGMSAGSADAMTFTVDQQRADNIFADSGGNNAWFATEDATVFGDDQTISGGLFRLTANDGVNPVWNFEAFCFQITQFFVPGDPSYVEDPSSLSPLQLSRLDALFTNAYSLVENSLTAGAFQFALWEITVDSTLDLSAGDFLLRGAQSNVEREAQGWLDEIASDNWTGSGLDNYILLASPDSQNVVGLDFRPSSEVPLPPSILFLVGGLAGLGLISRRRGDA